MGATPDFAQEKATKQARGKMQVYNHCDIAAALVHAVMAFSDVNTANIVLPTATAQTKE